ncbi:MAG: hypothetical protein WD830_00360 [Chloroflexota bacterium]
MQAPDQTGHYRDEMKASAGLAVWTLAWVGTLALAVFGPELLWDSQPVASWAAVATNVAAGTGLILAHARYLRKIDELQRKINLDALAITLGVGYVVGFAYMAASIGDLIAFDGNASIALFSVLLSVIYMGTIVVGNLRYR